MMVASGTIGGQAAGLAILAGDALQKPALEKIQKEP